jgi:hypothetical protein
MVRPIELAPIHVSLEEAAALADQEVLMVVDNNILMIVGDPRGIIVERLRPHPIHF